MKWLLAFLVVGGFLTCKQKPITEDVTSEFYKEQYRPQYHFSPKEHWMNDPNGMVFHGGIYHLFYQYYPDSTVWGPMHWGHATSTDLVHWKHHDIALYPDSLGYIFSGSAVIDTGNTAGFGKNAMVAMFTHHHPAKEKEGGIDFQYQSIAYSLDGGKTFVKYTGNPVIKNPGIKDFRDPKVFWYEKEKNWVMVLAAYDKVLFYKSGNLKDWEMTGSFGIPKDKRLWECPDLFTMKVEGSDEKKWVLITSIQKEGPNGGTATSYFVGNFDGKKFTADGPQQWLDYGKDNYAMVTWNNLSNDEVIALGWMSNWQYAQEVPSVRWRSANTLARKLVLMRKGNGYLVKSLPVVTLEQLEDNCIHKDVFTSNSNPSLETKHGAFKLELEMEKPLSGSSMLRFSNKLGQYTDVIYDATEKKIKVDRSHSGKVDFNTAFPGVHSAPDFSPDQQKLSLIIYCDHSSLEIFSNGGETVMTELVFPEEPYTKVEWIAGTAKLLNASFCHIKSIW